MVYTTSKFEVGKIHSSLHLPLKPDAIFKKQRASIVPNHLQNKVNRLLVIREQYEIISPVNKVQQPKEKTFINPVIILAKGESLAIVLDARYLNSLIDESKCNWPSNHCRSHGIISMGRHRSKETHWRRTWPTRCGLHIPILVTWRLTQRSQTSFFT